MKIFSYIIVCLSLVTLIVNATKISFENPLYGESTIALIGVVSALCAICVSSIYLLSLQIKGKKK